LPTTNSGTKNHQAVRATKTTAGKRSLQCIHRGDYEGLVAHLLLYPPLIPMLESHRRVSSSKQFGIDTDHARKEYRSYFKYSLTKTLVNLRKSLS
jgi:hypothetical protein